MAFIKEESEEMKIEEAFRVKREDNEEQTDLMALKEENQKLYEKEEKYQTQPVSQSHLLLLETAHRLHLQIPVGKNTQQLTRPVDKVIDGIRSNLNKGVSSPLTELSS
ncbi:unnamed protein product [Leuciscus chuanchicus]